MLDKIAQTPDYIEWCVEQARRFDKRVFYAALYSGHAATEAVEYFHVGVLLSGGPIDNNTKGV